MFNKLVGVNHQEDDGERRAQLDDAEGTSKDEEGKQGEQEQLATVEESKEEVGGAPADGEAEGGSEGDAEEQGDDDDDDEEANIGTMKLSEMTKEQRKEHKRLVKEENREKRKNKVPKHIKKKAEQKNKKK